MTRREAKKLALNDRVCRHDDPRSDLRVTSVSADGRWIGVSGYCEGRVGFVDTYPNTLLSRLLG